MGQVILYVVVNRLLYMIFNCMGRDNTLYEKEQAAAQDASKVAGTSSPDFVQLQIPGNWRHLQRSTCMSTASAYRRRIPLTLEVVTMGEQKQELEIRADGG